MDNFSSKQDFLSSQTNFTVDEARQQVISKVDSSLYEEEPKWGDFVPYEAPTAYSVSDSQPLVAAHSIPRNQPDPYSAAYLGQYTPAYNRGTQFYQTDHDRYYGYMPNHADPGYRYYVHPYPLMPIRQNNRTSEYQPQQYPPNMNNRADQYSSNYDKQNYNIQQTIGPFPQNQIYNGQNSIASDTSIRYFQNGYFHYTGQASQFNYRGTVYYNVQNQSHRYQENGQGSILQLPGDTEGCQYPTAKGNDTTVIESSTQASDTTEKHTSYRSPEISEQLQAASEKPQETITNSKVITAENDETFTLPKATVESMAKGTGIEDDAEDRIIAPNCKDKVTQKKYFDMSHCGKCLQCVVYIEQNMPLEDEKLPKAIVYDGIIKGACAERHSPAMGQDYSDKPDISRKEANAQKSIKADLASKRKEMGKVGGKAVKTVSLKQDGLAIFPYVDKPVQASEITVKKFEGAQNVAGILPFVSSREMCRAFTRKSCLALVPRVPQLYFQTDKKMSTSCDQIAFSTTICQTSYFKKLFALQSYGLLAVLPYVKAFDEFLLGYKKFEIEEALEIIATLMQYRSAKRKASSKDCLAVVPYVNGFSDCMQRNEKIRRHFSILSTFVQKLFFKGATIQNQKKLGCQSKNDNIANIIRNEPRLLSEKLFEDFRKNRKRTIKLDRVRDKDSPKLITLLNSKRKHICKTTEVENARLEVIVHLNAVEKYLEEITDCLNKTDANVPLLKYPKKMLDDRHKCIESELECSATVDNLILKDAELDHDDSEENYDEHYFIAMFGFH